MCVILARSPFITWAGSYIFNSTMVVAVGLQIGLCGLGQHFIRDRAVGPPDVHPHLGQHGALAGVKVKAHGLIFTDWVGAKPSGHDIELEAHHQRVFALAVFGGVIRFAQADIAKTVRLVDLHRAGVAGPRF